MAMTNSVTSKLPLLWVSARFHIRPSTSFGSFALSNICFAASPERTPFSAPNFSNRDEYSATLSGLKAGTRIGGGPEVGLEGVPDSCAAMGGAVGGGCCAS